MILLNTTVILAAILDLKYAKRRISGHMAEMLFKQLYISVDTTKCL